jgi:hypothetical protein
VTFSTSLLIRTALEAPNSSPTALFLKCSVFWSKDLLIEAPIEQVGSLTRRFCLEKSGFSSSSNALEDRAFYGWIFCGSCSGILKDVIFLFLNRRLDFQNIMSENDRFFKSCVSKGKLMVGEGRLRSHVINIPHEFYICLQMDSGVQPAGYSAPQIESSGQAIKNQDKRG